jgi:hypothetical protein
MNHGFIKNGYKRIRFFSQPGQSSGGTVLADVWLPVIREAWARRRQARPGRNLSPPPARYPLYDERQVTATSSMFNCVIASVERLLDARATPAGIRPTARFLSALGIRSSAC